MLLISALEILIVAQVLHLISQAMGLRYVEVFSCNFWGSEIRIQDWHLLN